MSDIHYQQRRLDIFLLLPDIIFYLMSENPIAIITTKNYWSYWWLYEPSESTGSEPVTYRTRSFPFFTIYHYMHVNIHRLNELLFRPFPCSNFNKNLVSTRNCAATMIIIHTEI